MRIKTPGWNGDSKPYAAFATGGRANFLYQTPIPASSQPADTEGADFKVPGRQTVARDVLCWQVNKSNVPIHTD